MDCTLGLTNSKICHKKLKPPVCHRLDRINDLLNWKIQTKYNPISVKSATYNSDLYVGWDWKAGFIDGCNPKLWATHIFRSIHTPEIWQKQAIGTSCKFWNYVHSWDIECQVVVSDIHYLKTINYIIAPAADQSRKCKNKSTYQIP